MILEMYDMINIMIYDLLINTLTNRDTELKMRQLDEEIKKVMIGNLFCQYIVMMMMIVIVILMVMMMMMIMMIMMMMMMMIFIIERNKLESFILEMRNATSKQHGTYIYICIYLNRNHNLYFFQPR